MKRFAILLFSIFLGVAGNLSIGGRNPQIVYCDIWLLILFYFFIIRVMVRGGLEIDKSVFVFYVLFIIAQVISMVLNGDYLFGIFSLKVSVGGFMVYILGCSSFQDGKNENDLISLLLLFALVLSIVIVLEFGFRQALNKSFVDLGWAQNNALASLIAPFIPIFIGKAVKSKKGLFSRLLLTCCCLLMIGAILITVSRGAELSLVAVFLILPLLLNGGIAKIKYITILAVSTVLISLSVVILMPQLLEVNQEAIEYRMHNADVDRIVLMKNAWEDFKENPVLGIGPFHTSNEPSRYVIAPHNYLLQYMAETGIAGTIPFMAMLLIILYRSCVISFRATFQL